MVICSERSTGSSRDHYLKKRSLLSCSKLCHLVSALTFSWISVVDCASQKATVATSFNMGISMEQSRPSSRAISGLGCMGPLGIGALPATTSTNNELRADLTQSEKMPCTCFQFLQIYIIITRTTETKMHATSSGKLTVTSKLHGTFCFYCHFPYV